jgi:hypothetical protein
MSPSLGVQGTTYLKPHEWLVSVSFRSLHSFRDFQGSKALPVPSGPDLYANTHVYTFDVSGTYAVNKRFSVTIGIPIQHGSRQTYYEHDAVTLHTMKASGVGDLKVTGNFWLLDPSCHKNGNIAVGVGLKAPTGNHGARDFSFRTTGRVSRPVDPAIQLGDGGWGILLTAHAFKKLADKTVAYAEGTYLSNPKEMNGTQSPFGDVPALTGGDIGYIIDSVPDQYLARGGITQTVWPKKGLSVSAGIRFEGVPAHDLIGGSEGYRLPGYAISIEPGFSISRHKNLFELTVPVAVRRHATKSVADLRTGNPVGGIAALADYLIIASYSRRF